MNRGRQTLRPRLTTDTSLTGGVLPADRGVVWLAEVLCRLTEVLCG